MARVVLDLAGAVVIREPGGRLRKRIAREIKRVGAWRFLDVLAFRVYHRLMHAAGDRRWESQELARLRADYPDRPDAPEIVVASPNSAEAQAFIAAQQPDLVIARCKTLLNERIFSIPRLGTYVMHPGICPEYRNAHGCFWALASGDHANVGMTLLRIDKGVDTGPVFGYFRVDADARRVARRDAAPRRARTPRRHPRQAAGDRGRHGGPDRDQRTQVGDMGTAVVERLLEDALERRPANLESPNSAERRTTPPSLPSNLR